MQNVTLDVSLDDTYVWIPHKAGCFAVKSVFFEIAKSNSVSHQDAIKGLCRGLVPHRIEIFSWMTILGINQNQHKCQIIQERYYSLLKKFEHLFRHVVKVITCFVVIKCYIIKKVDVIRVGGLFFVGA